MTCSFEKVTEEAWTTSLLYGKQNGTRVLVWVNYDLISLCKIFYVVEKDDGRAVRLILKDFPLPVFWDEEEPLATQRLRRL